MSRPWSDEKRATNCAKCGTSFGFFSKKEHCRACGKVFCNSCSSNSIQLPSLAKYYGNEKVRVCDSCFYKEKHAALARARKEKDTASKQGVAETQTEQKVSPSTERITPINRTNISDLSTLMSDEIFSTPTNNSTQAQLKRVNTTGVANKAENTTTATIPSMPPKSHTFASLPTSVRKDLQTKDVISSIFDTGDPFAPGTVTNTSKSNKSNNPTRNSPMKNSGNSNNNQGSVLNHVEIHTPYSKKNEATISAESDIFGSLTSSNPQKIPYTAASISIEPKPKTTPTSPLRSSDPLQSPLTTITNPTNANTNVNINYNTNSNNTLPTTHQNQPPLTPSPIPSSIPSSEPTPQPQPSPACDPLSSHLPPIQSSPSPSSLPPTSSLPTNLPPSTPSLPPPSAIPNFPISPHILQMPSPCVDLPYLPPRNGGFVETPKARLMQEKLFIRWINYYVAQRGVIVENLSLEFSDGVVFIHLLECYTRVLITDEVKAYCTPFPASYDEKYLNFYSGFAHLAYLQKPMPPIDILRLLAGDMNEILNLLWALLYRIEIEHKTLEGNDGVMAISTWVKYMGDGFPNVNILDFKKSFEDGLAFNSIISKHNPRLIDFNSLNPANKAQNVGIAFGALYQIWGVPMLLDVDDVTEDPDDICIIIYLSQCYDLVR